MVMCISLVRGRPRVDLEFCQRAENGKMISRGDYRGRPGLSRGRTAVGEGVRGDRAVGWTSSWGQDVWKGQGVWGRDA